MGCSKNLIDSERLIRRAEAKGYTVCHNPEQPSGEYVMVNTCGFIGDAKEESINLLLGLAELKKAGKIGKIAAMGCLTQRYLEDLRVELPEIDLLYGKFDWNKFIEDLPQIACKEKPKAWERSLTTPPHSAYLKISEGCNRFCAFCAIPLITGRHHSRPEDEIIEEVKTLVDKGVKEFNIIAQDLSSYGVDLYGEQRLAELVDHIADIPGVEWIRLHYAYPADFPLNVLDVMARRDNVCKYIDIALQHISNNQLRLMRRHITKDESIKLLNEIRKRVPDICIRTTLMVGFPGETEQDFEELMDFVKTQKFDRMGAFIYSEEDDTYAALNYGDNVPEAIKQSRLGMLMKLQQDISEENNRKLKNRVVKLLIDEYERNTALCRSEWDSPEVDLLYRVENCNANPGEFIEAEIIDTDSFDIYARQIN